MMDRSIGAQEGIQERMSALMRSRDMMLGRSTAMTDLC